MRSLRENILKYGTFVLVFILPLLYYSNRMFPHIYPKTFFFYGSVEILGGFWLYSIITDKSYRLSKKSLIFAIPATLYVLWMTLSTVFAINPELAFWGSIARGTGLLTLYHVLLFMIIVMSLVRKYGITYVYSLMQWFVNGGFILALSVWFGSTGFNLSFKSLMTDAGGGLAGNSSLAGAYFVFIIAFIFCLLFSKSNDTRKKKWNITVLTIILFSPLFLDLHAIFLGKSILGTARGALMGIIVGILTTLALYMTLSKQKTLRFLGIFSIVVGIIVFGFIWNRLVTPNTYLHEKFIEVASGTRFIFWDEAQKAMDERPLFGYGPENYMVAFQTYFNPKMVTQKYNHEGWNDRSYNVYYDTGVSGGYPAILFYGLFLGSILYVIYRKKDSDLFSNLQISVIFGLIFGYILQNLFYFDSVLSLMTLFVLGGIIFAVEIDRKPEKDGKNKFNPTLRNIIACVIFIFIIPVWIYFTYRPSQKVKILSEVIVTKIDKPFDKLLSGSVIGDQWDVSGIAHDAYKGFANDPLKTKNNKVVLPYVQKDLSNMIKYLEEIAKVNKYDYRLYISMIHLYSTDIYLGDKKYDPILAKHMLDLLDHARTLAPTNPEVYWGIAQVNAWAEDFKGIEKAYKEAIALDPTIPISHKLLIQFAEASGNKKLYDEALASAKKNIPDFTLN
jgi:O-antigen ligase